MKFNSDKNGNLKDFGFSDICESFEKQREQRKVKNCNSKLTKIGGLK
ncbi:hypothetical protein KAS08_02450 [Candidatus Pacearchaeota archaeon]|nr:hypothetical protein [Candidatus Pacearchaeota archaeon]